MEVEAWTLGPRTTLFLFLLGYVWDGQGLCRRLGSIIGIKLHHPGPSDCKDEKWCELALLNKGGIRSEDNVHQERDTFYIHVSTISASSAQEGRLTEPRLGEREYL